MTEDAAQPDAPGGSPTFTIAGTAVAARPLAPGLYLVATPIGNLGDITLRALETLAAADILAAEDTRITRRLLDRYAIARRARPYHEHNAAAIGPRLIDSIRQGRSVALVSDAGTPLVSDPGFRLVAAAREAGLPVIPVPGASSVLAALCASGMPTETFLFGGFLPNREGRRRARLEELAGVDATLVLFESPNRLADALADIAATMGAGRHVAVARELTKMHEELRSGRAGELASAYADGADPRGEIVIVVAPPEEKEASLPEAEVDALLARLAAEMPASKAAAEAARRTGLAKQDLFRRLVAMKDG